MKPIGYKSWLAGSSFVVLLAWKVRHSWKSEFDLNETKVNQAFEDRHKEKMEGVQLVKVRPSFIHNSNSLYIQLCVHMDKYVVLVLTHPYGHPTFSCGHLKIRL